MLDDQLVLIYNSTDIGCSLEDLLEILIEKNGERERERERERGSQGILC